MPTLRDIERALYELAPGELAMEGDNVGLLVGRPDREAVKILAALDVTEAVAERLGANLIVAHHPVMNCAWSPVQTLRDDKPQGRLLLRLVEGGIAAICMHTNLDRAQGGVNDVLAARLGLEAVEKLPGGDDVLRVGELPEAEALPDFLRRVKVALGPNGIRFADGGKPIRRVAVGGGGKRLRRLRHLRFEIQPVPGCRRSGPDGGGRGTLPHGGHGLPHAGPVPEGKIPRGTG